jgi:hypothetical protein
MSIRFLTSSIVSRVIKLNVDWPAGYGFKVMAKILFTGESIYEIAIYEVHPIVQCRRRFPARPVRRACLHAEVRHSGTQA